MAMATDLMGLGLPGQLAAQIAEGGTGGLTITAAGTTFATSTKLKVDQNVVSVNLGIDGNAGVGLPSLTVQPVALLADKFVINNTSGSTSLQIYASSGVSICVGGTNTSKVPVQLNTSMVVFPVSTTQWIGVAGA